MKPWENQRASPSVARTGLPGLLKINLPLLKTKKNSHFHMGKYILQFRLMYFAIWANIFCASHFVQNQHNCEEKARLHLLWHALVGLLARPQPSAVAERQDTTIQMSHYCWLIHILVQRRLLTVKVKLLPSWLSSWVIPEHLIWFLNLRKFAKIQLEATYWLSITFIHNVCKHESAWLVQVKNWSCKI